MKTETRYRLHYCGGRLPDGRDCRQPVGELDLPNGGRVRIRCLRCKVVNVFEAQDRGGETVLYHEVLVTAGGR